MDSQDHKASQWQIWNSFFAMSKMLPLSSNRWSQSHIWSLAGMVVGKVFVVMLDLSVKKVKIALLPKDR